MSLLEQAIIDAQSIISNSSDFGVTATLSSKKTGTTVSVVCLPNVIGLSRSEDGNPIASRNATVVVSERSLNELSYPVRDSNKRISMSGDKIIFAVEDGEEKEYTVTQVVPDESLGLITLFLDFYAS